MCRQRDGQLIPIGFDAATVRALLPRLGVTGRGDVHFNIVPRAARMLLKVPNGEDVDVTDRVGDLSWLGTATRPDARHVAETAEPYHASAPAVPAETRRFFARMEGGRLVPLDPVELPEGTVVLVATRALAGAPSSRALRRIAARGGPDTLPVDLAERHDYYAHGAGRAVER